jgi:hypothetical protein
MKKAFLLCMSALAAGVHATAQNEVDALRYSQLTYVGSARFTGMGGAFGALGGDISSFSFNPAGVAVYRKNELSFTPAFYVQDISSLYNGTQSNDTKYNFNFSHFGVVGSFVNKENDANNSGWVNTNIAVGYNRTNNFHGRMDIWGNNSDNTLLDVYAAQANGTSYFNLDQFSTGLMFSAGLIDTVAGDSRYYYSTIPDSTPIVQHKYMETEGAMSETVITFGGNYSNKVYVGATVGFPRLRYEEDGYYEEIDDNDSIWPFAKYRYYNHLQTRGTGFNFKIGMIYRVTDWLRLGGAVHTPSFFSVHDTYDNRITVHYDDVAGSYDTVSPSGAFDYRVTTPMRAIGSVAFLYNKMAMINVDYEFVDYTSARLRSSPNVFHEVNPLISEKYVATANIRAGAEVRFDPVALRVGYALYGSPYKNGVNLSEAARSSYSAGIGFRENNYFIDLAYVLTQYSENYYLYDASITNPVRNDFKSSNFLVTIGWKY